MAGAKIGKIHTRQKAATQIARGAVAFHRGRVVEGIIGIVGTAARLEKWRKSNNRVQPACPPPSLPSAKNRSWTPSFLIIAGILLICCIFSLRLFKRALPDYAPEPQRNAVPPPAPRLDSEDKLLAFVAFFGLTSREEDVLACIIRGQNRADISDNLGISDSTVKFHTSGLLKKTAQPNSRSLSHFFNLWAPPV